MSETSEFSRITGLDPGAAELWLVQLASVEVFSTAGERVRLAQRFRERVTVTGFLRHFGCLFCHQMVADLIRVAPRLTARGARVLFVGNGSVDQARRFFEDKGLPRPGTEVLTDPLRDAYRAADLTRGYGATFFSAASHRAYAEARRQGHRISGLFGDLTQLGGVLVTSPPLGLEYVHRSRFAGDHPDLEAVTRLVESLGGRAGA